ncbi:MAG: tRNA (adenosine(37)-N6)-threonylcarbamoyltransferase complex dimerization subunit type 1 TsaB [bacterium]|nr:tRNA (adenosine(37)-N6)-threonylcarbamoyltransferase complex dimerization subunit type 1 TsaB [bacterium]
MIFLIETSTEFLRMWIFDGETEKHSAEIALGRQMSEQILAEISNFLTQNNLTWRDLTAIGTFAGPGSFTGLRIGVTVANTLADALKIPIVGVSNSDFSKIGEENLRQDWRELAIGKLKNGEDHKIVEIFYGKSANITKQKK